MSNLQTSTPPIDPFHDPVGFLAEQGIKAEVVEVISLLPEAA